MLLYLYRIKWGDLMNNELLNNIISIIKNIIFHQNIDQINMSREDFNSFIELGSSFIYVICHPKDNELENVEAIDKIIKDTEFYSCTYIIDSKEFNEALKNDKALQNFMNNEKYDPHKEIKNHLHSHVFYNVYVKDGNLIHKFKKFDRNRDRYTKIKTYMNVTNLQNPIKISPYAPLVIEKSSLDNYKDKLIYDEKNDTYLLCQYEFMSDDDLLSATNQLMTLLKKVPSNKKMLPTVAMKYLSNIYKKHYFKYVKDGDNLVYIELKNDYDYNSYIKEVEHLHKFLIIDKNGNYIDNNSVNSANILKKMRVYLAHNKNKFNFLIKHNNTANFEGMFFILDDEKAIVFPSKLYEGLSHLNMYSIGIRKKCFKYLYCPQLKKCIENEDELKVYLRKLKTFNIYTSNKIEENKFNFSIVHLANKYNELYDNSDNLCEYLTSNLCKQYGDMRIELNELENTQLLEQKLVNNPYFFKSSTDKESINNQLYYINFIVETFYSFDITKKNAILPNGKSADIYINPKASSMIMKNIYDDLSAARTKKKYISNYSMYCDEYYITLCALLTFTNIINNSFDDDLEPKNSSLSLNELEEMERKIKVNANIFKSFVLVNENKKGNDKLYTPQTLIDFKKVISSVRNKIAHFDLKVKFSKSGNPGDNILIFDYDEEKSNLYYRITCKDFFEFITNPLFANYKSKQKKLIFESYDELIDNVVKKINDEKD